MIALFMGSFSDFTVLKKGLRLLKTSGIPFEAHVCSAHRTPSELLSNIERLNKSGCKVFIAAAGSAAHLAGVIAAHTIRPVIGVPLSSGLKGIDALFSTVQMPSGIPVATVAVDGAENAVYLAIQMLAMTDDSLRDKLLKWREEMKKDVNLKNCELEKEIRALE